MGYLKFPGWFLIVKTGTCLCAFKYVLLWVPSCKDKSFWGIIGHFLLRKWMDLWIAISQAPNLRAVFVCPFPPTHRELPRLFWNGVHSFLSLGWGRGEERGPISPPSSVVSVLYGNCCIQFSNWSLYTVFWYRLSLPITYYLFNNSIPISPSMYLKDWIDKNKTTKLKKEKEINWYLELPFWTTLSTFVPEFFTPCMFQAYLPPK